jgi:hypothetical protein
MANNFLRRSPIGRCNKILYCIYEISRSSPLSEIANEIEDKKVSDLFWQDPAEVYYLSFSSRGRIEIIKDDLSRG